MARRSLRSRERQDPGAGASDLRWGGGLSGEREECLAQLTEAFPHHGLKAQGGLQRRFRPPPFQVDARLQRPLSLAQLGRGLLDQRVDGSLPLLLEPVRVLSCQSLPFVDVEVHARESSSGAAPRSTNVNGNTSIRLKRVDAALRTEPSASQRRATTLTTARPVSAGTSGCNVT